MKRIYRICVFVLLSFAFFSLTPPPRLKPQDVRRTMGEMLAYHVEYKEFSPFLARRSLKVYLEQFDPERKYLLSREAAAFLDISEPRLRKVVTQYQQDEFPEYSAENEMIQGQF